MVRINKIYTRNGDQGKTQLVGGDSVSKTDLRVECYGTVDELNSQLGMCACQAKEQELERILKIQNDLFDIGSILACQDQDLLDKLPKINANKVSELENWIDLYTSDLEELKSFILPGGSELAARLHVARTVCRRAERLFFALSIKEHCDSEIGKYLNRLSDYLFAAARFANKKAGILEPLWQPGSSNKSN